MRVEPCICQRLQAASPECKRSTACFGAFLLVVKMEMTIDLWKSMTGREQTLWLEVNRPAGSIGAPRKPIHGFGLNDVAYCSQPTIDGVMVMCPAYRAWTDMLKRCYSKKFHSTINTYADVCMNEEWRRFSEFRIWWMENQVDGWQIDKDIIGDGAEYGSKTCIFVPSFLNSFIIDRAASRGEYPIGVSFDRWSGNFRAQCSNQITGKSEKLGRFDTPTEAHLAWLTRKLELALELKPQMDDIDTRIYQRVVEIIRNTR